MKFAVRESFGVPPKGSVVKASPAAEGGLRVLAAAQLTASDIAQWAALEDRAIEPNAYMSPHFVLPALRHLEPEAPVEIWFVQRHTGRTTQLIGACAFVSRRWSKQCPFPHVSAYQSVHSYLSGPLLDRDHAAQAIERMLDFARDAPGRGLALVLPCAEVSGPTASLMSGWARRHASHVHCVDVRSRSFLVPSQSGPSALQAALGSKFKDVSRNRRKLAEAGSVRWRAIRPSGPDTAFETFLQLEHGGWKAEGASSLLSKPAHGTFFREMALRFADERRVWFTELSLNERVIASTSNLISGTHGFAFKLGWDQEYRKYGVGILNEVELVENAPDVCSDLESIDSGAEPGSFIDTMWPGRRQLGSLILPLGRTGRALWRVAESARMLKQQVQGSE
ncbi:MAG: GNAT family N-acetyltransferase [Burkholderiaceae bacterium]